MTQEELLYRYFSKTLTPAEELAFNELLQSDADFKRQFEFETNLKKVIRKAEDEKLKAKLQGFEAEISKKGRTTVFNYRNFAVAASVAILMGVFGLYHFFGTDYTQLYQENFKTYPNTVYTITRSDDVNTLERQAFVAYETEDYQMAIDRFGQIPPDERRDYIDFYEAQAFLNLGDWDAAKQLFTKTIERDSTFVAESYWYVSLIYLKEKDEANAVKNLETLIGNYSYNQEKARALLNELD